VASSQPDRDADQIQADLGATRDRLAAAVEALIDQVHPQRIKQREVAGAKRFLHVQTEKAKSLVFNARGDLRTERVSAAGGIVAGAIALLVVVRALARRHG
jgi:hypothetical protein